MEVVEVVAAGGESVLSVTMCCCAEWVAVLWVHEVRGWGMGFRLAEEGLLRD
jgi:hypothetical protein